MEKTAVNDAAAWWHDELAKIARDKVGAGEALAARIAEAMFEGMRERIGGREVYIPAPDLTKRNAEIRRSFNGRNLDDVMRAFGVSRATVYRACR